MKPKVKYIQLINSPTPPFFPTDQRPYRKYAYTGGTALGGNNSGIEFYIPPTAFVGFDPNKQLEVELVLGHSSKGISGNLGFYTVEFDFDYVNQKTTTNNKYQTMYMKVVNFSDVERYTQEVRQKVRIAGPPKVIRTRYQLNGVSDYGNISPQLYLFKFTEV
ncbi:hypothetical protein [Haliea sp.]|uniref:hypothetical protein n=1 Tax=Haliea sp. TaxID=1932666 RepID=UPI00257B875C|nr:hypothetical protein [Haliea sp.]|tara:strand:+ start:370 stop:855 length:486 start_codon:yes stop_codon:yes gene_type:complete